MEMEDGSEEDEETEKEDINEARISYRETDCCQITAITITALLLLLLLIFNITHTAGTAVTTLLSIQATIQSMSYHSPTL